MKNKLEIQTNVPLAPLTTLRIGGRARFFLRATDVTQVLEGFKYARTHSLPLFVLGGGSNVLISDEGFDGMVLQVCLKGITTRKKNTETVFVQAAAGEEWDELVEFCVLNNLQGLECMSGIPGFVGGTPVQNVGAYGQEVSETIYSVRCFDRREEKIVEMTNADCGFAYRTSIFNTTRPDRYIVLSVTYALRIGGKPKIGYADLVREFEGSSPGLAEIRRAVLRIRSAKSMVIDAADPNSQSAGSFFKNPIVTDKEFAEVEQRAKNLGLLSGGEILPFFSIDAGWRKIPAAWLIERAGFQKGFTRGNVGLSTKHTLAITNRGQATAVEIINFKSEIQTSVREKFGVSLIPEPQFIGF